MAIDNDSNLKSKKFIAYLVAEVTWKILAAFALMWGWHNNDVSHQVFWLLMAIVLVAGFVEIGYILGQASLDKYLHLVKIASVTGKKLNVEVPRGFDHDAKKEEK